MVGSKHVAPILVLLFGLPAWGVGQTKRHFIPPPLRIYIPFEAAWNGMSETLGKNDLEIIRQDRAQGLILSSFREYISGPLTESHISKIGERPKLIDGDWIRVRYRYEVFVEFIKEKETLVTVHANIEALEHKFLGTENWVNIQTNGNLEEKLLTEFGQLLFGQNFTLQEPKKGFWERDPTYLPDFEERIPRIAGPERP
ncbi:MAG: hypothetical protein ACE5MK_02185 [Acidobacteriota bacterium]